MKRLIATVLLIIHGSGIWANENTVEVVSVEFPPISSLSIKDGGLAFQLLRQRTLHSNVHWVPLFLPPGRAAYTIGNGEWCASFYPEFDESLRQVVRLSEMPLRFGLLRKRQSSVFDWDSFEDFASQSIAVLRAEDEMPLYETLVNAGAHLAYVEKFQTGAQMVLLGRTDMALVDEFTYINMEQSSKAKLQFSQKPLVEMHIDLYINNQCANQLLPLFAEQ